MISISLTHRAQTDLNEILAYVGERDPRAAIKLVTMILGRIEVLSNHPQLGRVGRVRNTREFVLPDCRYIVAYRFTPPDSIAVLRVVHTARRWPKRM